MAASEEGFDLAGGTVSESKKEFDQAQLQSLIADLDAKADRRTFRKGMYALLMQMISVYLVGLFWVLLILFLCSPFIVGVKNAPALAFIGAALAIFAAIPLSLALTVRHLSTDAQDPNKEGEKSGEGSFSTAQLSLLKSVVDLVSAGRKSLH
ncbi:hypothetical protein FHT09_003020 [Xanthomonas arboricola]|uniref:hypothetical protein n=1 Tax=Xanthomonas TaxID=338 RepID=UPI0011B0F261|nr:MULTISPECIES: hypothetical protein [Xanthomonas]MBB5737248.1 hypothetical protein [Xanthomonas sp. CFBP 8152]